MPVSLACMRPIPWHDYDYSIEASMLFLHVRAALYKLVVITCTLYDRSLAAYSLVSYERECAVPWFYVKPVVHRQIWSARGNSRMGHSQYSSGCLQRYQNNSANDQVGVLSDKNTGNASSVNRHWCPSGFSLMH